MKKAEGSIFSEVQQLFHSYLGTQEKFYFLCCFSIIKYLWQNTNDWYVCWVSLNTKI